MDTTFERILDLIKRNEVVVSEHGYDELAKDDIFVKDILSSVFEAVIVEDYPQYGKGACVLVLQKDLQEDPIHVVWGIPKNKISPAVLVTAYKPDPRMWSDDFMRRKP